MVTLSRCSVIMVFCSEMKGNLFYIFNSYFLFVDFLSIMYLIHVFCDIDSCYCHKSFMKGLHISSTIAGSCFRHMDTQSHTRIYPHICAQINDALLLWQLCCTLYIPLCFSIHCLSRQCGTMTSGRWRITSGIHQINLRSQIKSALFSLADDSAKSLSEWH